MDKTIFRNKKKVQLYFLYIAIVFFIENKIGYSGYRIVNRENIGLNPIWIYDIRLSTAIIDLKK